jgi:hypothetical protein
VLDVGKGPDWPGGIHRPGAAFVERQPDYVRLFHRGQGLVTDRPVKDGVHVILGMEEEWKDGDDGLRHDVVSSATLRHIMSRPPILSCSIASRSWPRVVLGKTFTPSLPPLLLKQLVHAL